MVTAKTSELDKVKGLDLGADDYISKPFGVMELISPCQSVIAQNDEYAGRITDCLRKYSGG